MIKLFICFCQVAAIGFLLYCLASFAVPDPLAFVMNNNHQIEQLSKR